MKTVVLSGAIKNAGDFLIVERSKALLRHVYPQCEIIEYDRRNDLTESLEEINSCDVVVLAGGPAYQYNLYPNRIPLTPDLTNIKAKIFVMGVGWKGSDASDKTVYNYDLGDSMRKLLSRAAADTGMLGCRDWYSVRMLKQNGLKNAVMTGCPAWYNLESINKLKPQKFNSINKICISDPALIAKNINQAIDVVTYLRKTYSGAEIALAFHRGIEEDGGGTSAEVGRLNLSLKSAVESIGVRCIDISYGFEGMKIYDDCDLHVGYRVHAHIYNLSRGNNSILIEEDGRGAGVNQALGLPSLLSYVIQDREHFLQKCLYKVLRPKTTNPYIVKALDDLLSHASADGYFPYYEDALRRIQNYYSVMIKHIESIKVDRIKE